MQQNVSRPLDNWSMETLPDGSARLIRTGRSRAKMAAGSPLPGEVRALATVVAEKTGWAVREPGTPSRSVGAGTVPR